ncbi:MAG: hypothetical protein LBW77_03225, partial [Verrucomicrobiota bacterium]|nr:hypothetical protein [Verrucomicrobiota bacterium]
ERGRGGAEGLATDGIWRGYGEGRERNFLATDGTRMKHGWESAWTGMFLAADETQMERRWERRERSFLATDGTRMKHGWESAWTRVFFCRR